MNRYTVYSTQIVYMYDMAQLPGTSFWGKSTQMSGTRLYGGHSSTLSCRQWYQQGRQDDL